MADKLIRSIKAVSVRNKAVGEIGFLTEEEDRHWYNVKADEAVLDGLLNSVISKGNVIDFELENGFPKNFNLKEKAKPQENSNQDDLISFEDLLDEAHKQGLNSIHTTLVSVDMEKKHAVFKARVSMMLEKPIKISGRTKADSVEICNQVFEAYGDATQENCGEMVKKHWIRMAETRAIARALRWATNNAKTAAEETENSDLPDEKKPEKESSAKQTEKK